MRGGEGGDSDLHGGWYDATGDFESILTQLSHTAVYNPMQSLLPSYVCFDIADRMEKEELRDCRILKKELLDEAYWGADYAMRLHREGGGFIRSGGPGEAFSRNSAVRWTMSISGSAGMKDRKLPGRDH